MAIAKNSRTQVRYMEEVTLGTIPATALKNMRQTGANLNYNIAGEVSGEIVSDRNKTDYAQLSADVSGEIPFELSYDLLNDWFEGALFSDWSTPCSVASTAISAVASTNSFDSASVDFTVQNLVVGQWIRVAGFTTAGNNGLCKVVSIASGSLVVSGLTLADEAVGDSVTIKGSMLRNGVARHSYTVEKEYTDIAKFLVYTGMMVNNLKISVAPAAKITGSLSLIGVGHDTAGVTFGTGAHTAATTNSIMNGTRHVSNLLENGAVLGAGIYATNIEFTVNNNLSGDNAIGSLNPVDISEGACDVTGTATYYFSNTALYDKYLNDTSSSISFAVTDGAGNTYVISFPNINYTAAPISGDTSIALAMTFQAIKDATLGFTMQIDKIPA